MEKHPLSCHLLKEKGVCVYEDCCLRISTHFVRLALGANGHWDIYFGPFVLNQFDYEATMWFNNFSKIDDALKNYALIFQQISLESKHYERTNWEQWYEEQIGNVLRGDFHPEDVIGALNYTSNNPWVEKLLIGLQGWEEHTGHAIKYLNVHIDDCDWQQHQAYNSSVSVTGDKFVINYLIENHPKYKGSLAICLKAPCLNPHYTGEILAGTSPK